MFTEALMLGYFPDMPIHMMFVFLLDIPVMTFFLVFFFGQHLTCGDWGPRFWLDRLCVDQTDETTKSEGIAGLPTIVANSFRMLVLWDKSYFERLWCNFELSIFVKSHGLQNLRLMPLWLTPWLLTTMLFSYCSARLLAIFTQFADPGDAVKLVGGDTNALAVGLQRLREYALDGQVVLLFCLPPIMVGVVSFQKNKKLDGHRNMLESHGLLRCATCPKCAETTLKPQVQAQVARLFDGLDDPVIVVPIEVVREEEEQELIDSSLTFSARLALRSVTGLAKHDDCLEEFNKYVQGPMRDAVVADLGEVTDIPYAVCVLAMLPWTLSFAPFAWIGRPELHALGYRSDFEYFAVMWTEFLFFMLVCPAVYPCLLRCVKRLDKIFDRGHLQTAAAFICGWLMFSIVQFENGFVAASLESFVLSQHPAFLGFFLLAIVAAMFQHYMLFGSRWRQTSSREIGM
ncbi:unnamed protein product [Symbiodinium sp. CCMP2592]|nr:unnamed protein product [Symbiodinium sp. CCMP2592]